MMSVSFVSYDTPRELPFNDNVVWIARVECNEGYVGGDGCTFADEVMVTGQRVYRDYQGCDREVVSEAYEWVCPVCGHEYSVEKV